MEKSEGRFEGEEDKVGARRYIRTKLRMEPTTRVEKTKSSSFRPKLGREAMSPRTHELTPTTSSMRTLKGNWGSAATLDCHPLMNKPINPRLSKGDDPEEEDESSEFPSPPRPPELHPPPALPPSPPLADLTVTDWNL